MIKARAIERFRRCIGIEAYSVDLPCQLIDGLDQAGIAAQAKQYLVKAQIAVEHSEQITGATGRAVLAVKFFEPTDFAV